MAENQGNAGAPVAPADGQQYPAGAVTGFAPGSQAPLQPAAPGYNTGMKRERDASWNGAGAGGGEGGDASKRQRVMEPSRVVHVRNLPPDVTEADLFQIAGQFGQVAKVLVLKNRSQGFIQLADRAQSSALINYYAQTQAMIRGRSVYFQYSTRDEITSSSSSGGGEQPPNRILLISVQNQMYPITVDVLHQIFARYGNVQRIVIFTKNCFQALIEYDHIGSAQSAKALDGQNIYQGCCTLQVQFSRMQSLQVRYNNDKSRDYTNPSLPPGPAAPQGMPMGGAYGGPPQQGYMMPPQQQGMMHGQAGAQPGYGYQGYNTGPPMHAGPMQQQHGGGIGPSPVVLARGLVPERMGVDQVFTLFGVYGDVLRVKILFTKTDHALVQMATPQQAQAAVQYLNGCTVYGSQIMVSQSKYDHVDMPKSGTEGADNGLTKDFSDSSLHRFRLGPGSKNLQHIVPPSQTLHLSNLPDDATEEQVRELFGHHGEVSAFRFFPQNHKMALVQMDDVPHATEALIQLHGYKLSEHPIRVSFTKSQV